MLLNIPDLEEIAAKLTSEINDYTDTFNIRITANKQLYDKWMTLEDKSYIPAILTVTNTFTNDNKYSSRLTYQLAFYVLDSYVEEFKQVIANWTAIQLSEVISGNQVVKTTENLIPAEQTTDNGSHYEFYTLDLTWTYLLSLTGENFVLYIDDEPVPFVNYEIEHTMEYITNETSGDNYRMTNDTVVLSIPLYLANTKVLEMYNLLNNDYYNKTIDLKTIVDSVEHDKTLVIRKARMSVIRNSQIAVLVLTCETHYPRLTIQLDGVSVPVISYSGSFKTLYLKDNRDGEDVSYGVATDRVRSWNMIIVNDNSDAYDDVKTSIKGSTLGQTFTFTDYDLNTYTVEIAEMQDQFTSTGNISIDIALREVRA